MMKNSEQNNKDEMNMNVNNKIKEGLRQIRNGSITIVKQNNTVVQINFVEKLKLV